MIKEKDLLQNRRSPIVLTQRKMSAPIIFFIIVALITITVHLMNAFFKLGA